MRTLLAENDRQSIAKRIQSLTPNDKHRWGKMQVGEMICHLTDSFRLALDDTKVSMATGPLRRSVVKWVALKSPTKWPQGVPTRPELEQGKGGTPPTEFELDRARLLESIDQFCATPPTPACPHPIFGVMTHHEWMRWGWLHTDHHLRQFGR
jgi:hypothetical protein